MNKLILSLIGLVFLSSLISAMPSSIVISGKTTYQLGEIITLQVIPEPPGLYQLKAQTYCEYKVIGVTRDSSVPKPKVTRWDVNVTCSQAGTHTITFDVIEAGEHTYQGFEFIVIDPTDTNTDENIIEDDNIIEDTTSELLIETTTGGRNLKQEMIDNVGYDNALNIFQIMRELNNNELYIHETILWNLGDHRNYYFMGQGGTIIREYKIR
jgi:hypothetical protein